MGRKLGMTQTFTTEGHLIPITVIKMDPSLLVRVKTKAKDGYDAVQLGFEVTAKRHTRAHTGQFTANKYEVHRYLYEVLGETDRKPGQKITAQELFTPGMRVDVAGVSKGRGTTGVIKKNHQSRGPKSHGSHHYRRVGSRGSIDPNRIFKGQALPGRMGHWRVTTQGLTVIRVDAGHNLLLVMGSTPGHYGSRLIVKKSRLVKPKRSLVYQTFTRSVPVKP